MTPPAIAVLLAFLGDVEACEFMGKHGACSAHTFVWQIAERHGAKVSWEVATANDAKRSGRGRLDLWLQWPALSVAVEVDNRNPRFGSIRKLELSAAHVGVVVCRNPSRPGLKIMTLIPGRGDAPRNWRNQVF